MQKIQKIFITVSLAICSFSQTFAALPSGSSLGPTAIFFADTTSVKYGEAVKVDASSSHDSRGNKNLEYRWDCTGTYDWTDWRSSAKYTCTMDAETEGSRYIRLQVRDSDGFIDETKTLIYVKDNVAGGWKPVGIFDVTPKTGTTDTSFNFIATVSSSINTPEADLEVRWDWEGDGEWDTDWSLSRSFFHSFDSSGIKEVWMQVRDRDDSTYTTKGYWMGDDVEDPDYPDKYIGRFEVTSTSKPSASFRVYPTEASTGAMIHFDASGSSNVSEYRWDYDGDGTYDTGWSSDKTTEFEYDNAATFNPRLQVRSSGGELDTTERQVIVSDSSEIPPTAKFTVTNSTNSNVGSEAIGALLDKMRFNASQSHDRDNNSSKLQARWDFDGDGIWDTTFGTSKTAYHQFETIGVFNSMLEVQDSYGNTAQSVERVQIVSNTAPEASLKVSPLLAAPGTRIRFDASGSTDDQSGKTNLDYRFDFTGDGIWDTEFKSSSVVTQYIEDVGVHTAIVEVRDVVNAVGRATAEYEIYQPEAPTATFSVEPTVGTFATTFKFDASGSSEPTGVDTLKYRWDFDSSGPSDIDYDTSWYTTSSITKRYSTVGQKRVCLVVKNSANQQNTHCEFIEIHEDSPYLQQVARLGAMTDADPDQLVTRADLAKIVSKAARIYSSAPTEDQFTDVPKSAWYAPYVRIVTERGWMSPKNNFAFEPNNSVNRAEAAKVIVSVAYPRVADFDGESSWSDIEGDEWYARFAEVVAQENLLETDDDQFSASAPVTRGEVARMLGKLIEKYGRPEQTSMVENAAENSSSFFASILDAFNF